MRGKNEGINKDWNISCLRLFATISIIWLHTCSTLVDNPELYLMSDNQWKFFKASYHVTSWAVPIFFMITGMLLLNPQKDISVKEIFSKYCSRIFSALFTFGIPFAIIKLYVEEGEFYPAILIKAIGCVFTNSGFAHFWYLYCLIGIYLLIPLLKLIVNHASKEILLYFLTVMFILLYCVPTISVVIDVNIAFSLPVEYPVFYVLLGYYLKRYSDNWSASFCLFGAFALSIVIVLGDYLDIGSDILAAYDSPVIAIIAILIFMLFKGFNMKTLQDKRMDLLWRLDRCCFGVYIIHPIFIHFTYRMVKITPLHFTLYPLSTIAMFLIFTICSFSISWVVSHIKPFKHIL